MLSGIHGLPKELWNSVANLNEGNQNSQKPEGSGYCTHGSLVFPTWHRVYILMFEVGLTLHLQQRELNDALY